MTDKPRVLVACDLSEPADEAIRQADAWARANDADLLVCHVIPDMVLTNPLFPQRSEGQALHFVELAGLALDRLHERIGEITGRSEGDYDVLVASGEVAAALLREAEEIDASLVVVGSRGTSGIERLLLGDVARRVVRYATCPVLVARPVRKAGFVLAATDFSDAAQPALLYAATVAKARGARLGLIHCIEVAPDPIVALSLPFGGAWSGPPPDVVESARATAENVLRDTADRLRIQADVFAEVGNAPRAIIETAEKTGAELVAISTHGRTGLHRLMLGSVAEKVVSGAPCSVLVVRSG